MHIPNVADDRPGDDVKQAVVNDDQDRGDPIVAGAEFLVQNIVLANLGRIWR